MTSPFKVLKFPCSDGGQVLVQATSKGTKPLDLKLVGTEGSAAYRVTLKQDRVLSLRVKNCPVSEPEWQEILEAVFQLRPPSDIQATASVEPDESISITVRKIIQGTTHRLGSITLNYTEDEEIGLFEWCAAAVDASLDGRKALAEVERQQEVLVADVKDYKRQLNELLQAKNEDETALLQKFRDLLNEKKLRIREQQKIISAASFPDAAPPSPEQQASPRFSRKPAPSRAGKRKATTKDAGEGDATPDSGEMEIDDQIKVEEEETDPGNTTEGTASTEGDDDSDAPVSQQPAHADTVVPPPPPQGKLDKPPPPRSLPFDRKKASTKQVSKPQSETDSDDDEL